MKESIKSHPISKLKNQVVCPVEFALRILGGKWRGSVLYQLKDGGLRFNELKLRVQDAVIDYEDADNFLSNKVLSSHLKALMIYQLIEKRTEGETMIYELSSTGQELLPILIDLFYWGERLMELPFGNLESQN